MQKRKIFAASLAAVLATSTSIVATATQAAPAVTLGAPDRVYTSGLTFDEVATDFYMATVTPEILKKTAYSGVDTNAGRGTEGYYYGFYLKAFDKAQNGGTVTATYTKLNSYYDATADAAAIKAKVDEKGTAGSSDDGQFWTCTNYSWVKPASGKKLIYTVKATMGATTKYYSIAIDCDAHAETLETTDMPCEHAHTNTDRCTVCGHYAGFDITVPTTVENGTVTVDEKAEPGEKVAATITPEKGYTAKVTIKYTNASGEEVTMAEGADGYTVNDDVYEFTMPASNVTIGVEFEAIPPFEEEDTTTGVTAEADPEVVPEGTKLVVEAGENDPEGEVSYDITLEDAEGNPVQPKEGEKVTVSVPVPTTMAADKEELKVFYKDDKGTPETDDDTYEDMEAALNTEKTKLVFNTSHFSTYVITKKNLAADTPVSETHKVTISTTIKNGTVTPDKTEAKKDDKVTLTVKANDGYEIEKVTFKSGDTEKEIEAVDGKYPFVMPDGDVTVSATFKEKKAENNDTYKITDTSTDKTNGNLAVDKVNAKKGDKVTLTVKAKEGYELDKLTVTDADKNEIKYTKNDDGTYSFTMPAGDVNFNATFKKTAGTNPVGPSDGDNNGGNGNDNKNTGIALAVAPVVLAGACAVVLVKKKR